MNHNSGGHFSRILSTSWLTGRRSAEMCSLHLFRCVRISVSNQLRHGSEFIRGQFLRCHRKLTGSAVSLRAGQFFLFPPDTGDKVSERGVHDMVSAVGEHNIVLRIRILKRVDAYQSIPDIGFHNIPVTATTAARILPATVWRAASRLKSRSPAICLAPRTRPSTP